MAHCSSTGYVGNFHQQHDGIYNRVPHGEEEGDLAFYPCSKVLIDELRKCDCSVAGQHIFSTTACASCSIAVELCPGTMPVSWKKPLNASCCNVLVAVTVSFIHSFRITLPCLVHQHPLLPFSLLLHDNHSSNRVQARRGTSSRYGPKSHGSLSYSLSREGSWVGAVSGAVRTNSR